MKDGISIVMAYHNRREQLIRTLNSINETKYDKSKLEIIIINDNSLEQHSIDDLLSLFNSLKIRIFNIKKEQKKWTCSCVPYNIGFNNVQYNKILFQNPECYHIGDILSDINLNLSNNNYIPYACYSIGEKEYIDNDYNNLVYEHVQPTHACSNGWYNHSKINSKCYHFASAITTDNLYKIGGFDEDYKDGIAFDDNEILRRIRLLGLNINIIDYPYVIHQWHDSVYHFNALTSEDEKKKIMELFYKNQNLYDNGVLTYKAKNNFYFNP
jgi:GT2 family glycosyltransferase